MEDDDAVQLSLLRALRLDGYESIGASNGVETAHLIRNEIIDLIILDVGLPGEDGFAVCRSLRANGFTMPVMMLTARSQLLDRVVGLDCGADDYLSKPFELVELYARIRALLRRSRISAREKIRIDDLEIDPAARYATRAGVELEITATEFDLLLLLARREGEVLHRDWIFEQVWKHPMPPSSNSLEVYIASLRRKLELRGATRLIHTVRGIGYVARKVC